MSKEIFLLSKKDFGRAIRGLRTSAKFRDAKSFARLMDSIPGLDVSPDKVRNWENGRSYPDAPELLAIMQICGIEACLRAFGIESY
jgi:DNA-binding transcriptional regulator YiaG